MANKKFTDLTIASSVENEDILAVTIDPTGTPASRRVAVDVLMAKAPVQSVAGQTGAVVLDADDIDDASTTHKFVTASDITNLGNLSGTNTGDQDLSSYQLQPSEGAFVDGDKTKLDGIEASADVTDTANVQAAGALMDSEVTNLAEVKAFSSADYATAAQGTAADSAVQPTDSIDVLSDVDTSAVAPTDGQALVWDNSNGKWEPGPAGAQNLTDLNDVTITSATAEQVIKYDGSGFVNGSIDVDTPVNTAIRGTENPHIGAYPEQSFRVTDNPNKSVMVIADADGNLEFLTKDGANIFVNTPSSRLALAKGFSVQEDGDEPDIEAVTPSGVTYSVISGDSDTKGVNGLPIRQGFNFPDIGANPAPILISGGTIA